MSRLLFRLLIFTLLFFYLAGLPLLPVSLARVLPEKAEQELEANRNKQQELLQELLRLDTLQEKAKKAAGEATAAREGVIQQLKASRESLSILVKELPAKQAWLGSWLRFLYEGGRFGYLGALLGAESWSDLLARWELSGYLLQDGLARLEEVQQLVEWRRAEEKRLVNLEEDLRRKEEKVVREVAGLASLQKQREETLEGARLEGVDLESLLAEKEERWRLLLPELLAVFQAMDNWPWPQMEPDNMGLDLVSGALFLEVGEDTLNRALAAGEDSRRLRLRLGKEGITLMGELALPGGKTMAYTMEGPLRPAPGGGIAFLPLRVASGDLTWEGSYLDELAGGKGTSFSLPPAAGNLRVEGVDVSEGKLRLTLRPYNARIR